MSIVSVPRVMAPETMLRMAQSEIDDLKARLAHTIGVAEKLSARVHQATLAFCVVVLQAGGKVTITPAELEVVYAISLRTDPATHAKIWTVAKQEPKPAVTN